MYQKQVAELLTDFASGRLSRDELAVLVAPVYADDDFVPDGDCENEPWRTANDEASLLLWLVHLADVSVEPEELTRQTVARALACYEALGARETLEFMWLIFDQDRFAEILEKVERRIISRTAFLNVLSNARYAPRIKSWLSHTNAEGLRYLRRLLQEEAYDEIAILLRT